NLELVLERLKQDSAVYVRTRAIALLITRWSDHPGTLSTFKEISLQDKALSLRYVMTTVITTFFRGVPGILDWARERCTKEEDPAIRMHFITDILNENRDASTLKWLKGLAANDTDPEVRR